MNYLYQFIIASFVLILSILSMAATPQKVAQKLYQKIHLQPIKQAIAASKEFQQAVESADNELILVAFTDLIVTWKKVQAGYVAGILDKDVIDHPDLLSLFMKAKKT